MTRITRTIATALAALGLLAPLARADIALHVIDATNISTRDVSHTDAAVSYQLNHQVRPTWGSPRVAFGHVGWNVYLVSQAWMDARFPGYIGYHTLDSTGQPVAYVADGSYWSAVLSHEAIEMVVNPWLRTALEPCDPVQWYGYYVGDVYVSDFVTPRWFNHHPGGSLDWMRVLRRPGEVGPGGYVWH